MGCPSGAHWPTMSRVVGPAAIETIPTAFSPPYT